MTNSNEKNKDPLTEHVDTTSDDTTNLRDDGSMEAREIEKQTPDLERPDAHEGNVPGQVDPRMAEAAAKLKHESKPHDESFSEDAE